MKQAIAGVAPSQSHEVSVMIIRPSISVFLLGRLMGRLFDIKTGMYIFTVGNILALSLSPVAALLYFMRLAPVIGFRYKLTNRRVVVQRGLSGVEEKSVALDAFDSIDVVVRPGQQWYHAGDLVFQAGGVEKFRLNGVSRPHAFRTTCLHSHRAYSGVKKAIEHQAASA